MASGPLLTSEELERYSRQIILLGKDGQVKLKKSKVLVVGAGGLGSTVLYYLAAAGVGRIIVVDREQVELSNLNRQILYTSSDIGLSKANVALRRLRELNPNVDVLALSRDFDEGLAEEVVPKVDLAIDALDNWDTRILLNKVCVKYRKPLVHAGVEGFYGQLMVIIPGETACLQCIIPIKPHEKKPFPIIGPIPGILGAMEALESIKILVGLGEIAKGKLVLFNGYSLSLVNVNVERNPKCPVCSHLLP
ncbi:MAG: HesA/MoeB/ThiF family protein [Desulfurococcaceae archaeon]